MNASLTVYVCICLFCAGACLCSVLAVGLVSEVPLWCTHTGSTRLRGCKTCRMSCSHLRETLLMLRERKEPSVGIWPACLMQTAIAGAYMTRCWRAQGCSVPPHAQHPCHVLCHLASPACTSMAGAAVHRCSSCTLPWASAGSLLLPRLAISQGCHAFIAIQMVAGACCWLCLASFTEFVPCT